ncbi:MAG TPA: prephenate dehydratase, partial [Phnomibacter sp.]|nr:prephenate dehydratase [Phnomibacter sp.]
QCGTGVMAIENSIAGSILPNYTLLQKSKLCIVGEVYLTIKQQLLVNPGVQLQDIREVHSHPMALLQCMDYLEQFPHWKLIETEDTALSAKHIHQRKSRHQAAIAGKLASELFSLEVLAPDIHTLKNNYTRFLVVKPQGTMPVPKDANKASVKFHTDHSKGSLAHALVIIAEGGVNLSKLQSMPIPGTHFKYSFHADMEFESLTQFESMIQQLEKATEEIRIFGIYKNGKDT